MLVKWTYSEEDSSGNIVQKNVITADELIEAAVYYYKKYFVKITTVKGTDGLVKVSMEDKQPEEFENEYREWIEGTNGVENASCIKKARSEADNTRSFLSKVLPHMPNLANLVFFSRQL